MDYRVKIRRSWQFTPGFTLVEVLLTIVILALLTATVAPTTLDFYRRQQLHTYTQEIIQILRRTQLSAMSTEGDSNFGVYFTSNNYILFRGDSYTLRDIQYDEVFDLPSVIGISGLSEVVFLKPEGRSSQEGQIVVTNNIQENVITINGIGRVNLEP